MQREPQDDDVIYYNHNRWYYRYEWDISMGDDYDILMTETPEWVDFMENEA